MKDILQLAGDYADVTQSDQVEERRAAVTATLHAPIDPGTTAVDGQLGSRPALWIEPAQTLATRPVVLYLHGGVYEVGSASDYQAFCSKLALRFDAAVVPLDYRLAPEHPFPAAVDDSVGAYRDLLEHRPPTEIAIIGDSAGGGLTVAGLIPHRRRRR